MPLLTPQEHATLNEWGFLEELVEHLKELLEVARAVYSGLSEAIGPLDKSDLPDALRASLMASSVFGGMVKRRARDVKRDVHVAFADAMSRYLIDNHWNEIVIPGSR
jgi:hypothetical protein